MFVGREAELQLLNQLWERSTASLIVCVGRRRIGKSRLIQEWAKDSASVFFEFQGLAPDPKLSSGAQLRHFMEKLSLQSKIPNVPVDNWNQAFALLDLQISRKKTVLLLDEISWMGSEDGDFVGKLKVAWDTLWKKHHKLNVVLCGSVSSWIQTNLLNKTDFYGRISLTLQLEELPLSVANKFWGHTHSKHISSYEKFKVLNVIGCIPRYLEDINPKESAESNLGRMCAHRSGILFDEFDKIFNVIFNQRSTLYKQIVKELVLGSKNLTSICNGISREKSGIISNYLNDMVLAGFIAKEYGHDLLNPSKGNKNPLFRLKDNYLRFYLKFLQHQRPKIEKGLFKISTLELSNQWNIIMGLQFESLLLNNIKEIISKLGLDLEIIVSAGPYRQNKTSKNKGGCQIDLLLQTTSQVLYLCEFKFKKSITSDVCSEMEQKIAVLQRPRRYSIRTVLIYEGELTASKTIRNYFYKVMSASELFS
ncbi:MAG: ATP-binding protein [Oligoflexia bacterium]|nr:ATP-binding protein [Oligoflexia bacterium]MBF0364454.1 ATP-binding protein [Oligoflexia bacterium]